MGLAVVAALSGCASATATRATQGMATGPSTSLVPTGANACPGAIATPQAQLPATGGRAWVWFQSRLPPHAGQSIKVVWKFDGASATSQSFGLDLALPGASVIGPVQGEFHTSSSWTLGSGMEWGSYFAFPRAGCWQVDAHDGHVQATVTVDVLP